MQAIKQFFGNLLQAIKCFVGLHKLQSREREVPWTALFRRERCQICGNTEYFKLGTGCWYRTYPDEAGRVGGFFVNFDELSSRYVKDESHRKRHLPVR